MLLSGPREWSIAETVRVLGKAVGKEVRVKQVAFEEYVADPLVREKIRLTRTGGSDSGLGDGV